MNDRMLVATRKGLFVFARRAGREPAWQVDAIHFLGEPVTHVLADARSGTLLAALNLGHFGVKMWRSGDDGGHWDEVAVPSYPPQPEGAAGPPWKLVQIWSLEAAGRDAPGTLWAGTLPGGLFRSDDGGSSWSLVESLWQRPERPEWFGGGYDVPGIHSICIDPRDSRRLSIAVSCGGVWSTADGGASWAHLGTGLEADYMPPERRGDLNVQDPHRMVSCAAHPEVMWIQHHCSEYRSTDGGAHWQELTAGRPSRFGFAVAAHPTDPLTAWFVPAVKDACRVPVDARFVVSRTRDGGASFDVLSDGLPVGPAYDLIYRHGLAVDASGECLAMGSTTGGVWVSSDRGDSWRAARERLPPVNCVRFA